MRVLVCIPCLLVGGTEVQTLNLARALVEGGHRVLVAAYFEHCPQMVENYRRAGCEVALLSPGGDRPAGRRMAQRLWTGLRRVMREFRPDAAHVQYMAPGAIPILMLRALGVRTVLVTAHTAADIYPSLRLVHFIQRHCVRAFQCITERAEWSFFGSSSLFSADFKLGKRNHFTIYNSLPEYIEVRKDARIFDDKNITIGVVSRLESIKGMDLVVPAFAEVAKRRSGARLLVVGDGSQRELMERQASELGVADSVEFAGRKQARELQGYYDRIDILLMPSRSEGFGLTAIEGMARGCVVVAANTGGLPEVVKDGVTGLLHEPGSAASLAEKISALLDDTSRLGAMSERAVDRAAQFSFEKYREQIGCLYAKLGS